MLYNCKHTWKYQPSDAIFILFIFILFKKQVFFFCIFSKKCSKFWPCFQLFSINSKCFCFLFVCYYFEREWEKLPLIWMQTKYCSICFCKNFLKQTCPFEKQSLIFSTFSNKFMDLCLECRTRVGWRPNIQHSLFLRIITLFSWLKSTLLLKIKCFDTHI